MSRKKRKLRCDSPRETVSGKPASSSWCAYKKKRGRSGAKMHAYLLLGWEESPWGLECKTFNIWVKLAWWGNVMLWISGGQSTMSGSWGNMRQVTPIHMGCKSDRLGFSYMGWWAAPTLLYHVCYFRGWIWSASMMTGLRQGACFRVVV